MSKKTVTILVCDRCQANTDGKPPTEEYNWGKIWFSQCNGPMWIGSPQEFKVSLDMCTSCLKEVYNWWIAKK